MWVKLWCDILSDPKLMRAQRHGYRTLHLTPWTIVFAKQCHAGGRLQVNGEAALADDLSTQIPGRTAEEITAHWDELLKLGILKRDDDGVLTLVNWVKRTEKRKPSETPERVRGRVAASRARKRGDRTKAGSATASSPSIEKPEVTPLVTPSSVEGNALGNTPGNAPEVEAEVEAEGETSPPNRGKSLPSEPGADRTASARPFEGADRAEALAHVGEAMQDGAPVKGAQQPTLPLLEVSTGKAGFTEDQLRAAGKPEPQQGVA